MRGIYTPVTDIRRKVFTEVARMAYNANELSDYAQPVSYTHLTLPTICSV